MKLLERQEVSIKRKFAETDSSRHIAELREEETKSIKAFNSFKEDIERQKNALLAEYHHIINEKETEKRALQGEAAELRKEIERGLTEVRIEKESAQKISAEAEAKMMEAQRRANAVSAREDKAKTLSEEAKAMQKAAEKILDREEELIKREAHLKDHVRRQKAYLEREEQKLRAWHETQKQNGKFNRI